MLILVGPSASGKTEAVKLLINKYHMKKLVTYTSRTKRVGEVDDVDYHFIDKVTFEERINNNFFLEYVCYNGNYYGTAYEDLASDKVVILEPSGVKTYLNKVPELVKICYLKTPIDVRIKRMKERGDDIEAINMRVQNDDSIFTKELEDISNWVILSSDISLEDMTKLIFDLYEPFICQ